MPFKRVRFIFVSLEAGMRGTCFTFPEMLTQERAIPALYLMSAEGQIQSSAQKRC